MEPQNNLQKNIGVTLGIIVMFGVLSVTIFFGRKNTSVSTTDQALPNGSSVPSVDSPNPVSSPKIPTVATPKKSTPFYGDGGGEGDDENFGTTPVAQTPLPPPAPVVTQTSPALNPKKSVYKDGTYSATGSYMSPGGPDQLAVTLTLKNDIIVSVSVVSQAGDNTSQRYQDRFIASYKQYVLGQNIANVFLTKISGASLTPKGFNDALAQIKSQARA